MDNNYNNFDEYNNSYEPQYSDSPPQQHLHPPVPAAHKKRARAKRMGYIASLLAVSLCSGVIGGGISYHLASAKLQTELLPQSPSITAGTEPAVNPSGNSGTDIAQIAAKASVSVVEINVESTQTTMSFFGPEIYNTDSRGSGVIISADGYIVTNDHVVGNDADNITVRTNDGEEYEARLVGSDEKTDLAVIKIEATGLQPVTFADSDSVVVGELAVAIGNSLGTLGGTVTDGIISATNREITIEKETMTLLQTSAAVNPGNSGGGLFNANGDLIGVVNAKSAGSEVEGLGFAIPSNLVKEVTDNIIENGYVAGRPELGISVIQIDSEESARRYLLEDLGVYIAAVTRENGLKSGDRIVSIDGEPVEATSDVSDKVASSQVGDEMEFAVIRGGEEVSITVIVGEQVPEYIKQRIEESSRI